MIFIHLIKIRLKQLLRGIRDMGVFRVFFLATIIIPLLGLFMYSRLIVPKYGYTLLGIVLVVIFIIHRRRKDYMFLSKLSDAPVWIFYTVEYVVFSAPLPALLFLGGLYMQALVYVVLLLGICFVKPSPKGAKTKTYHACTKYIPTAMFEWRSGIRVNLPFVSLCYGLGLAGVYNIGFSAVSLAILSLIFNTFYGFNEPQKIVIASEQSPAVFLRYKLGKHLKYWALLLLPLFGVASLHYQYWMYILITFAVAINLLAFAILAKYAYYRPSSNGALSQVITSLAWLCTIILPLSILVLITNIVLYFKAKHNLTYYLNAYH